ncbi:MAG: hypothetical protein QW764_02885 [Desulfurococcaceae archaeon]
MEKAKYGALAVCLAAIILFNIYFYVQTTREITVLRDSVRDTDKVLAEVSSSLAANTASLNQKLTEIRGETENLRSELAKTHNELRASIVGIERVNNELRDSITALYAMIDETKTTVGSVSQAVEAVAANLRAIDERLKNLENPARYIYYGSWYGGSDFVTTFFEVESKFKVAMCFIGTSWDSHFLIGYVDASDPLGKIVYFAASSGFTYYDEREVTVPKSGRFYLYVVVRSGEIFLDLYLPERVRG